MNEVAMNEAEACCLVYNGTMYSLGTTMNGNGTMNNTLGVTMNGTLSQEEVFMEASRFWVQRVFVPIVVTFGSLGNLATICILTRRPMRSSTNVYLCALAISDLLFLLFTFTMSLAHYKFTKGSWYYWVYRSYGLWLTDASSSTSVYLTLSFTVERYIAVCHPMRGKILCTEERALKVAFLVYIICFLVTVPTPFEWELSEKLDENGGIVYGLTNSDFGKNEMYVTIYYWFTSLMFTLLPIVVLGVFNFFLIMAVRHSRQTRRVMTNLNNSSARHLQAMRQENRITITLIAVVVVFLICQLPTAVFLIFTVFHPARTAEENALYRGIGGIFNLLMSVNAASNFLLYTALSDKYRKYFCALIFFWRRRGRHGRAGFENPFEMDTVNTTISLSRGTSLRTNINHEISPRTSPYGLRRTHTCGNSPNNLRPELSVVKGRGSILKHHIKDSNIPLIQVDQV